MPEISIEEIRHTHRPSKSPNNPKVERRFNAVYCHFPKDKQLLQIKQLIRERYYYVAAEYLREWIAAHRQELRDITKDQVISTHRLEVVYDMKQEFIYEFGPWASLYGMEQAVPFPKPIDNKSVYKARVEESIRRAEKYRSK